MRPLTRILLFCFALGGLLGAPSRAAAWMQQRVESSSTLIELDAAGTAIVRHELALDVRGAPLVSFALDGVDADAEPLADATITRMKGGIATSLPLPVRVSVAGGRAEIAVPLKKGFPGRTFLVRFGYRTRLLERGLLRALSDADVAELRWLGPRFGDGVDSVTLLVRSAAGARAPEAAPDSSESATANFGIVMSTLRRSQQRDELELVRAHVARGESTAWRVLLDARLFPALAPTPPSGVVPALSAPASEPEATAAAGAGPAPRDLWPWLAAGGLLYALLVRVKAWSLASAARLRRCRPRALAPWGASLRALLAGASLAAAAALAIWTDIFALAAGALLLAIAFACELSPRAPARTAEAGSWQPLDEAALAPRPRLEVPGAWLDVGRPHGFVLLVAALAGVTCCAARLFETSPHYGASVLLGSVALLPIFCTGRAGQLPLDAREQTRRFTRRALRRLRRIQGLAVTAVGRSKDGREPDELRVSIAIDRALPGLLCLELGLEFHARLGGFSARPVVVVRAADGSLCQRALPRSLRWGRGRKNDERATLIHPKLPTLVHSIALIQELLEVMRPESAEALGSARTKAAKASGKGLSTAKAGTRSSPLHAT